MRDAGTGRLAPELNRAIQVMRREPEPVEAWRAQLLTAIAEAPRPERARVWTVRPWIAVAAALACVAVGASSFAIVSRASRLGSFAPVTLASPPVATRSTVRFTLEAPGARTVSLVGDFNAWSPSSLPLRTTDGRTWIVEVPLAPGRYAYSFLVDGALASDPAAPRATDDDFGSPNSVVLVKGS